MWMFKTLQIPLPCVQDNILWTPGVQGTWQCWFVYYTILTHVFICSSALALATSNGLQVASQELESTSWLTATRRPSAGQSLRSNRSSSSSLKRTESYSRASAFTRMKRTRLNSGANNSREQDADLDPAHQGNTIEGYFDSTHTRDCPCTRPVVQPEEPGLSPQQETLNVDGSVAQDSLITHAGFSGSPSYTQDAHDDPSAGPDDEDTEPLEGDGPMSPGCDIKVPRDLSCDVHKSIGQKVDRDSLGREGPNEMKLNEREKREVLGIQD